MPVEKKILISGTEDPREISAARPKKKPCPGISIAKIYGRLLGVPRRASHWRRASQSGTIIVPYQNDAATANGPRI